MELTVKERFLLLMLLPAEGNISTIRIVHNLRQALALTDEEYSKFGVEKNGDEIRWRQDVPQVAAVEISPRAFVIIQDALKDLNAKSKITEELIPLWEKFVETE